MGVKAIASFILQPESSLGFPPHTFIPHKNVGVQSLWISKLYAHQLHSTWFTQFVVKAFILAHSIFGGTAFGSGIPFSEKAKPYFRMFFAGTFAGRFAS